MFGVTICSCTLEENSVCGGSTVRLIDGGQNKAKGLGGKQTAIDTLISLSYDISPKSGGGEAMRVRTAQVQDLRPNGNHEVLVRTGTSYNIVRRTSLVV